MGESPTRQLSFRPVAIGAAEEVTNPLKYFGVEGRLGRLGERAGRNASERRAGLETLDAEADPPSIRGRPLSRGKRTTRTPRFRRGIGVGMHVNGNRPQHGKPHAVRARDPQPELREEQAGPREVADRPVLAMTPGNAGNSKGALVQG